MTIRALALLTLITACASKPPSHTATSSTKARRTAADGNPGAASPAPTATPATATAAQDESYRAAARGRYLDALLILENFPKDKVAASERAGFFQALASIQSWVGDTAAALESFDEAWRAMQPPGSNALNQIPPGSKFVPALPLVASVGRDHRAIFVNEAHHVPRHRAFTLRLLRDLRAQGFTHFAAETLTESDAAKLNERGYPIAASGYYSAEPTFGELVREARRLGYRIVAYEDMRFCNGNPPEDPYHCQNMREEGQAANLKARIFDKSPNAKVLVHAGYGHIGKRGAGGWKPMAVYFREMTGVDPYVVDQTTLSERGSVKFDSGNYLAAQELLEDPKHAADPLLIETPPRRGFFTPPTTAGLYDLLVFHPRTVYQRGRETWREMGGTRAYADLAGEPCRNERPCLLEARRASEPADGEAASIASDLIVVRDGQPVPSLLLPRGSFRVRAWGSGNRLLSEQSVVSTAR